MPRVERRMQFVVKVSKLCNLRCTYCYEFAELGRRERMSLDHLATLWTRIRDLVTARDAADGAATAVDVIWHGGEPLLIEPEHYWRAIAAQRRIVDGAFEVQNLVQTNLTRLDDERLRLLRDGFDRVGVSVDVGGTQRVNLAGRDSHATVVANLERLRAAGVPFGCITVLTRENIGRTAELTEFYGRRGIPFRALPLFDAATAEQSAALEVTLAEELTALCELVDQWLEDDRAPQPPEPLGSYFAIAAAAITGRGEPRHYSRRDLPRVLLVNTDGECYTLGDPYGDPEWSVGNVFTTSLADILASPEFDRNATAAETRQALNCLSCPYFGACDGSYVAEAESQRRDTDGNGVRLCTARPVIEHVERRLRQGMAAGRTADVAGLSRESQLV